MRLKEENPELNGICRSYNLRGFSLREYLNLKVGLDLKSYNIREIQNRHERIAQEIMEQVNPLEHIRGYLHHGYYPFFLEQGNFTERLHRMMNLMIEVDILHLNQIELKYLDRLKKLFYQLATGDTGAPNVSQLAGDVQTFARHGDELHQVPHRCTSDEYGLPQGRGIPQEAGTRHDATPT